MHNRQQETGAYVFQVRRVDGPHLAGIDVEQADALAVELDGLDEVESASPLSVERVVVVEDLAGEDLHRVGGYFDARVRFHHTTLVLIVVVDTSWLFRLLLLLRRARAFRHSFLLFGGRTSAAASIRRR